MTDSCIVSASHGGTNWNPATAQDNWESLDYGADSEFARLRIAYLNVPDPRIVDVKTTEEADWFDLVDYVRLNEQVHALRDAYEALGVQVVLNPPMADCPVFKNTMFCRDLFVMTPMGAIVSRMASAVRRGEELVAFQALARDHIPIIHTVTGEATFEGPDIVFVDKDRAFIAESVRSNRKGVHSICEVLKLQGVEVTELQTTYGCGHLDGVLSIIGRRTAVVYPQRFSFTGYLVLKELGYTVIELPCLEEAEIGMAINMVAVDEHLVVAPKGCPKTKAALEKHGVNVVEVDVSEAQKGGGAVHCLTGVVHRDFGWK